MAYAVCLASVLSCGAPGASSSASTPALPTATGVTRAGIATFYDADGTGNCSFDAAADLHVAAAFDSDYAGSAACGGCVEIKGPSGTTTVRIVDRCPDCAPGHLDLSRQAFAEIADPSLGRVDVEWTPVSCQTTGNLSFRFKEGSSQWWTAIQVRNHRVAVASLAWQHNGAWEDIHRELYNYFVLSQGIGTGPHQVRITGSTGEVLEDTLAEVADGQTVSGAVQFAP